MIICNELCKLSCRLKKTTLNSTITNLVSLWYYKKSMFSPTYVLSVQNTGSKDTYSVGHVDCIVWKSLNIQNGWIPIQMSSNFVNQNIHSQDFQTKCVWFSKMSLTAFLIKVIF